MSQTFTSPADWSDYFHSAPSTAASIFADHHHFTTAMGTPTTDPNPTSFSFNSGPGNSNNPVNRSNRVTKPARKRSRASRRTPTTLLSTNTSNFRAMVQQFTGGPSALGFGIGDAIDHPQPRRVADHQMSSSFAIPSGYSFQFQQQGASGGGGGGEVEQARRMIGMSTAGSTGNVKKADGGNSSSFLY
uniref:VQ domain-containing protein n=1 Tax=Kalanchoe fedtschenkoi TaxID=63787 RepID=A0A7N0UCU5_KALFE